MSAGLKLASSSWDEEEIKAMQEVIKSGDFSMGKKVLEFEREFASYVKSKYSIMINSGSSANLLMIAALFFKKDNPLKPGDEVIVPAVSWSTTYYPLSQYGLKLKFVDIDKETLNYDLKKLSEAISENTRLLMIVNILGNPNNFSTINEILKDRKIIIVEDNCESLGAKFKNKFTGTFGIMGSYSSFFSHHISTMEGGLITTDDIELYHILLSIRSHGWTRNLPKENKISALKSDNEFEESFKFILPGYNLRPLEISAAVGLKQLIKLPNLIKERRKNAEFMKEIISSSRIFSMQKEIGESSWFGFAIILKNNKDISREKVFKYLDLMKIEYRPVVTGNFLNQPVCKYIDIIDNGIMINANYIDKNAFYIGNHHYDISNSLKELKFIEKEILE
ncbi:DegT/DnrJ/EryC1/StrS family aminotransferase [Prochlorococcus marinus XMU1412]|uniref:DegT/DnrJ/EryC1/StrS family aminotransferase n=1 Tax=Prochlorococcus marinus TaxID=1219 RepID=UPI001ADA69DA|nr:DegT/DnrJ/EryC1/StrS family aminotransferase [Prochlorococcus marinus]MBO8240479.1 DegT/DnrJ/EryC1/StrS family aminotransferase [Prochlorococcus marinus XMU1412]MBW3071713.1 pyridoxamine 5-phosphate oxidase [Prochlorococcus marinus str. MU1412]